MSNVMTSERLATVVTELLESAVFVFADKVESTPWDIPAIWCACLELEHEQKIQMSLCVPKELALTLAANLLGLEPDSVEAEASLGDAVGEMANMLAGILAVELFGSDVVCKIGVPKVIQGTGADHDAYAAKAFCWASLKTEEGYRMDACLLEGDAELVVAPSATVAAAKAPAGESP
jgi:hypothetical protein